MGAKDMKQIRIQGALTGKQLADTVDGFAIYKVAKAKGIAVEY
jgi:hypothetical protein